MNASYGSGWEALFDVVIYVAKKPGFWASPQECWGTDGSIDRRFLIAAEVRHTGNSFDKGWEYTLTTEMKLGGHYKVCCTQFEKFTSSHSAAHLPRCSKAISTCSFLSHKRPPTHRRQRSATLG